MLIEGILVLCRKVIRLSTQTLTRNTPQERDRPQIRTLLLTVCAISTSVILITAMLLHGQSSTVPAAVLAGAFLITAMISALADRPRRGDILWMICFGVTCLIWLRASPTSRVESGGLFSLLIGAGAAWISGLHIAGAEVTRRLAPRMTLVIGLSCLLWLFIWFIGAADGAILRLALGKADSSGLLYSALGLFALSRLLTSPIQTDDLQPSLAQRWSDRAARRPASLALLILSLAAATQAATGPMLAVWILGAICLNALQIEARQRLKTFPFGRASLPILIAAIGLAGLAMITWMTCTATGLHAQNTDLGLYWALIGDSFLNAPLSGHGLGAHSDLLSAASTQDAYTTLSRIEEAGLWPARWLVETGLLGVTSISAIMIYLFHALWRGVQAGSLSAAFGLVLCWMASVGAATGAGIGEPPVAWLFSFLIACAYAASRHHQQERAERRAQ